MKASCERSVVAAVNRGLRCSIQASRAPMIGSNGLSLLPISVAAKSSDNPTSAASPDRDRAVGIELRASTVKAMLARLPPEAWRQMNRFPNDHPVVVPPSRTVRMVNVPSDRLAAGPAKKLQCAGDARPVTKAGMREPDVVQTISYKSSESKRTYGKDMTDKPYVVYVDGNFHYMNEEERCGSGEYATLEEAVSKCQRIVDEFLEDAYKPGMSSKELYDQYRMFGEDPFVRGPTANFSAWAYAKRRCDELCCSQDDSNS
jgi:hypothetical protein